VQVNIQQDGGPRTVFIIPGQASEQTWEKLVEDAQGGVGTRTELKLAVWRAKQETRKVPMHQRNP
jgi:hypothetical protein